MLFVNEHGAQRGVFHRARWHLLLVPSEQLVECHDGRGLDLLGALAVGAQELPQVGPLRPWSSSSRTSSTRDCICSALARSVVLRLFWYCFPPYRNMTR